MKHYEYNGQTFDTLPSKLRLADGSCISPITTDEQFVSLGGAITDDGEATPKEAVIASLNALIHEIAEQVDGITVAEFKQAARTLHSGELVDFAREAGVSEEIINAARIRIVEIMADALREGMSWAELVEGIRP